MSHIKNLRKKAGFRTSKEAAEALKISYSMMKKLDCGNRKPSIELACLMTKVFTCTLDEIFLPYIFTKSEAS